MDFIGFFRVSSRIQSFCAVRTTRDSFWLFSGTIIHKLLLFFALIYTARDLGAIAYGQLVTLRMSVETLSIVAGLGLGPACSRFLASYTSAESKQQKDLVQSSIFTALTTTFVLGSALIAIDNRIAQIIFAAPSIQTAISLSAILLIGMSLLQVQQGILAGLRMFRDLFFSMLTGGIASTGGLAIGCYLGGLNGAILGLGLGGAVQVFYNQSRIVRWINNDDKTEQYPILNLKVIRIYALPSMLTMLTDLGSSWLCYLFLLHLGVGFLDVARFNAANVPLSALLYFMWSCAQAAVPTFSELISQNDSAGVRRAFRHLLFLQFVVVGPLALAGMLFSPWILGIFGADFVAAWPCLIVALFSGLVSIIEIPLFTLLTSVQNIWPVYRMNLGCAVVTCIFGLLAAPLGPTMMAVAFLVAHVMRLVWCIVLLKRTLPQMVDSCLGI